MPKKNTLLNEHFTREGIQNFQYFYHSPLESATIILPLDTNKGLFIRLCYQFIFLYNIPHDVLRT